MLLMTTNRPIAGPGRQVGGPGRPEPASDEQLLARYRDERRPDDLAELYRRHAPGLRRYLARYLGDPTLAEDVVQEAFLVIQARCGRYRDGRPARPWLYAVAVHRAVDLVRKARRRPALRLDLPAVGDGASEATPLVEGLAVRGPGPLEALQERERRLWARRSVEGLPGPMRQVVTLAYDEGLSHAEIGRRLGLPTGTVSSRLHKALTRLRKQARRFDRPARP